MHFYWSASRKHIHQDLIKEKLHVMFYTEKIPQTFAGVVDASPGLTFLLVETLRFLPF